jgi:hypothetical protein
MHDSRLMGIWKSDAKRTAREIAARRDIPASKKRKLRSLFGKLELRYTRTHCHSLYDGNRTINRYVAVARDSSSVAIVSFNSISGPQIFHIHFEGKHYWICLGKIREHFKRKKRKAAYLR